MCAATASALVFTSPTFAQTPAVDLDTVQPVVGSWSYRQLAGASEADFTGSGGHERLVIRCSRTTRVVSVIRTGVPAASPFLVITTSYGARSLPSTFAGGNLAATLAANDPLLDEIAFSRGKWAIADSAEGALVVPNWAEPTRVIEDCRS